MFGVSKYTSYQNTPASTWTINHGLGFMPIVEVLIDSGGVLKPALPVSIVHNNANTVTTITWSAARTGRVILAYGV